MADDLKQQIAITALNEMMRKGHFNICAVDSVGELIGIDPRRHPAYLMLRPLHCLDWHRMPPDVRAAVPDLIQQCLGITAVFQFKTAEPNRVIDITPPESKPERKGFLRLIGM